MRETASTQNIARPYSQKDWSYSIPCRNVSYLFTENKAIKPIDNSSNGPDIVQTLIRVHLLLIRWSLIILLISRIIYWLICWENLRDHDCTSYVTVNCSVMFHTELYYISYNIYVCNIQMQNFQRWHFLQMATHCHIAHWKIHMAC